MPRKALFMAFTLLVVVSVSDSESLETGDEPVELLSCTLTGDDVDFLEKTATAPMVPFSPNL